MSPVTPAQYLQEYYGANNVMVIQLPGSHNYEVTVMVQDNQSVKVVVRQALYEEATRWGAMQQLIIKRINKKIVNEVETRRRR